MIILAGSNAEQIAKGVAKRKKAKYAKLIVDKFPDGELRVKIPLKVRGKKVAIVTSMHPNPNDAMIEMIFASKTAKRLGAKKVVLIAPYIAYMRQDKEFHFGECISARIMGQLLSCADEFYAIDPHLHRISHLRQIFKTKASDLTSDPVLADYISKRHPNAILIGPDWESYQWAQEIAKSIGLKSIILKKKRYSATKVKIVISDKDKPLFKGQDVVIVDDIISTGRTMIEPIKQLKKIGAKKITCIAVHGVFEKNALQNLRKLGAKVITTNTIPSPVSKIDVSQVIADVI